MRTIGHRGKRGRNRLLATVSSLALAHACPALGQGGGAGVPATGPDIAQAQQTYAFDIPAQALPRAIAAFSAITGLQVLYTENSTFSQTAPALRGTYTAQQALERLLADSNLVGRYTSANAITVERQVPGGGLRLDPIAVEGAVEQARFGDAPVEPGGFKADYQTSATKTPLPIRETPQSISVATRDSIDARQARDVNTALELTAGVSSGISSGGGPFAGASPRVADQFSLRGQRLDGDRDVRIDGFSAASNRNDFDLAAFERVDVIKGPSSMLYGQGSIGGFINLVRKKPEPDPRASLTFQAGSFDTYHGEADVTGAFDADRRFLGRMTVAYDDSGSFVDGVDSRRAVVAPSLEARIGERTRALLQVIYQDDSFNPSLGIPVRKIGNELIIPNIERSLFFGVPASEDSTASALHSSLRLDHELNDRWLATLLLHNSLNQRRGLADNYGYGFYGNGNANVYAGIVEHHTDAWAGELRLDGKFDLLGLEHSVSMGLESNWRRNDDKSGYTALGVANIYANNFASLGTIPAGTLPITFSRESETLNKAAYAQLVLSLTERTKLLVGSRYDRARQRSVNTLNGGAVLGSKMDEAATLRAGMSHDLSQNITAFATFAQSFNPVDSTARSGDILDPETGEGFEVGLKTEWFDKQLGASVAVFRQDLDNRPIADPTNGPGENFSISAGLQRTNGVEVEVAGSPYPGVTVGAASAWLFAEFIDPLDQNFGLIPPETTSRQSSLFASYRFGQGMFEGFGVGATLVSIGKRWSISGGQNFFLDGHERVDLNFYYDGIAGLNLSLQVRNLLDATYIERNNGAFNYGHYFGSPLAVLFRAEMEF